jgi:hypothetical protein
MSIEMQSGSNGQCAIYGCPLFGSMGRGVDWVCHCHHDAAASDLQAITAVLRQHSAVGAATVDIRLYYGSDYWPSAYRGIQRRLIEAGLSDLLFGSADCPAGRPVVRQWLARLEGYLLQACDAARSAQYSRYAPRTVPTSPIIGPTNATGFLPYRDNDTVHEG